MSTSSLFCLQHRQTLAYGPRFLAVVETTRHAGGGYRVLAYLANMDGSRREDFDWADSDGPLNRREAFKYARLVSRALAKGEQLPWPTSPPYPFVG